MLNSTSLIYMFIFMPVSHYSDHYSFVLSFKIEKCASSNFALFKDCQFGVFFNSISILESTRSFMRKGQLLFWEDCTESVGHFGGTLLSLQYFGHCISTYILESAYSFPPNCKLPIHMHCPQPSLPKRFPTFAREDSHKLTHILNHWKG